METIGSLIDKMSINELKIYNMEKQKNRTDRDEVFKKECEYKLSILYSQREDMMKELQDSLDDYRTGRKRFKIYLQMKMYNDEQYK